MGKDEKPAGQKPRTNAAHAHGDAKYVDVGKVLRLTTYSGPLGDLDIMNTGKTGRPYRYPDTVMMSIAGLRNIFGNIPYRLCQGMAISALGEKDAPDHVTLWRRIHAMDVRQEGVLTIVRKGKDTLCLIPDAKRLASSVYGDRARDMPHGFIRLSLVINQEPKEILAFRVSDEGESGSLPFRRAVDDLLNELGVDPKTLRADTPK